MPLNPADFVYVHKLNFGDPISFLAFEQDSTYYVLNWTADEFGEEPDYWLLTYFDKQQFDCFLFLNTPGFDIGDFHYD